MDLSLAVVVCAVCACVHVCWLFVVGLCVFRVEVCVGIGVELTCSVCVDG